MFHVSVLFVGNTTWYQHDKDIRPGVNTPGNYIPGYLVYLIKCMVRSSVKSLLKKNADYKVTGSLWIECEGERFFGPGRVELLQKIEETGSINKAAKQMQMSYKKAWEMINTLNAQASKPFVITQAGGEKGGGSVITAYAKECIAYHQQLRRRFEAFLEEESKRLMSL